MIHQQKYVKELIKRFGMESVKPIDTPISPSNRLIMDDGSPSVEENSYRRMIGSLLYLTASRSDIVFSVGLCACFQFKPKKTHLKVVKQILGYLKLLWIRQQFTEFSVNTGCIPIFCDNTSAINITKNPCQHKRTKDIDIRRHFLRDNVERA